MQERQVWLLGWKGPSEKNGNLLQNSSLGNPGTEETGWLQSTGPLTVWTQLSNDTTIYQATVPVVPQTDLELWGTVCECGSQHILEALLWVLPLERLSPLFSACLPHVPVPITIPFSSDFTIFRIYCHEKSYYSLMFLLWLHFSNPQLDAFHTFYDSSTPLTAQLQTWVNNSFLIPLYLYSQRYLHNLVFILTHETIWQWPIDSRLVC